MKKMPRTPRRIVIITEGQGEYKGLPRIYPQLHLGCDKVAIIRTLIINVSPDAPPLTVAKKAAPSIRTAQALNASQAIVLLDRERQRSCPGQIASILEAKLRKLSGSTTMQINVVLKDRAFENWLISDVESLKSQRSRFDVTPAVERLIVPDRADRCDATSVIKRIIQKGQYHKIEDAERICASMDVERAAKNSRSFRHFLHVVGYDKYKGQCQQPA
jgi:hypothetical protein